MRGRHGRVAARDVVVLGQQAGGQVEQAAVSGVADGVGVEGRDAADGINGVVNGREHDLEFAGGGGEACRVAGRAGVGAGGCPARVGVGEPPGPQDEVLEFSGDRGDVPAVVDAGGDGVPVVCDGTPGGPGLADGIGRVGQLGCALADPAPSFGARSARPRRISSLA